MESKPVYQLDHPRLLKALIVFIVIGTFNSMVRLIASSYGSSIGFELLLLLVTALVPWVHYLNPSSIGAMVLKILSVIQGVVSAFQLFYVFEPEFQFSRGPGIWLWFLGSQILSFAIHVLLFRAANVHMEKSGFSETVEWLDGIAKDK
ncbi:hypothetical protein [Herbaspirillum rubrisubalbicans]|uniref:hypothetical protein n=1 Tax=Herbaspirillum rubrisubalbicans TaxID=80842 RepID=UPI0015C5606E|nr:hypothetical protein [Herbaspirillum rubrisubalbicans]NQE50938.1 hypothetical protein [Herbaspirillum rubrisubalbicans]